MSAVTILGVEPRINGSDWEARTPAGIVIVFRSDSAWRWQLWVDGELVCWRQHALWVTHEEAFDAAGRHLSRLLSIGRAQGLREAAGIARTTTWAVGNTHVIEAITAAAERAERGEG